MLLFFGVAGGVGFIRFAGRDSGTFLGGMVKHLSDRAFGGIHAHIAIPIRVTGATVFDGHARADAGSSVFDDESFPLFASECLIFTERDAHEIGDFAYLRSRDARAGFQVKLFSFVASGNALVVFVLEALAAVTVCLQLRKA